MIVFRSLVCLTVRWFLLFRSLQMPANKKGSKKNQRKVKQTREQNAVVDDQDAKQAPCMNLYLSSKQKESKHVEIMSILDLDFSAQNIKLRQTAHSKDILSATGLLLPLVEIIVKQYLSWQWIDRQAGLWIANHLRIDLTMSDLAEVLYFRRYENLSVLVYGTNERPERFGLVGTTREKKPLEKPMKESWEAEHYGVDDLHYGVDDLVEREGNEEAYEFVSKRVVANDLEILACVGETIPSMEAITGFKHYLRLGSHQD